MERGQHGVDNGEAFGEVEAAPFRDVVIRGVDQEAELANAGEPGAMPQAGLDIGGHYARDRCCGRQGRDIPQHVEPWAFIVDYGFQADDRVLKLLAVSDIVSRAPFTGGKQPGAAGADVLAAEAKQVGMPGCSRGFDLIQSNPGGAFRTTTCTWSRCGNDIIGRIRASGC